METIAFYATCGVAAWLVIGAVAIFFGCMARFGSEGHR